MSKADITQSEWEMVVDSIKGMVVTMQNIVTTAARHEERLKVVEKIVYGAVALILTGFLLALANIIYQKIV